MTTIWEQQKETQKILTNKNISIDSL